MKHLKIIIEIEGVVKEFWVTIATSKEIVELTKKLDKAITSDISWVEESFKKVN